MKLYIKDGQKKIYLKINAPTKRELAMKLNGRKFIVGNKAYTVNDVYAEATKDKTAASMAIGGVVGAVGGISGVIIGSAIGGLLGNLNEREEQEKIKVFNRSKA